MSIVARLWQLDTSDLPHTLLLSLSLPQERERQMLGVGGPHHLRLSRL